jgi:nitrogen regulatory protein PII
MLAAIIPRGAGEKVARAAVAAGAGGGTVMLGRGTAPGAIMQFLGLGERAKDIVLNIVEDGRAGDVGTAVADAAAGARARGVMFSTPVEAFARGGEHGKTEWRNAEMNGEGVAGGEGRMAVVAIVNRDYADDALAAARRAGAGGGTVLQARGTASEHDAAFFGVRLVPEKDVLVIVAEDGKAAGIVEAIRSAPCFAEKGSGIVFAVRAEAFAPLGA